MADLSQINQDSQGIRDETGVNLNSAARVGGNLVDITTLLAGVLSGSDTTANILAKSPNTFLGQTWWSTDEKSTYRAVDVMGVNKWKRIALDYDGATDTYKLSTTDDGQTQNLGQEGFFVAQNDTPALNATASAANPEVFKAVGVVAGDEEFKSVVKVTANDVAGGDLVGLNTTDVNAGGKTKIAVIGDLNDVDTSAWTVNTVLYIDPAVEGGLTNIKPAVNAFPIAVVTKSDAVTGKLYVSTLGLQSEITAVSTIGRSRIPLGADEEVTGAGTFYRSDPYGEGVVGTATQVVAVGNNTTLPLGQDWLGIVATQNINISATEYFANIEFQVDNDQVRERLYLEVYLADADGNVVDSGSGLPNGTLGQPPITVMQSPLLNVNANFTVFAPLTGVVATPLVIAPNQRVRYRILCEKVGAMGPNKNFTVYSGTDHDTWIETPEFINAEDVQYDNTNSTLTAGNVEAALDELDAEKVNNTGDTMTGNLIMDNASIGLNRADGTLAGVIIPDDNDNYGFVVGGSDSEGNASNFALFGANIYMGTGQQFLGNDSAVPYGYLKLAGTPVDDGNGNVFYPISFQQIEQELYSESFQSGADFLLTNVYQNILVSTPLVNSYSPPGDFEYAFVAQEQSTSQSTEIEYQFLLDGVPTGTVQRQVINPNTKVTVTGGNELSSSVAAGVVITLQVRAVDVGGSRVTRVLGSDSPTEFTIRQLGFGQAAQVSKTNMQAVEATDNVDAASKGVVIGGFYYLVDGTLKVRTA